MTRYYFCTENLFIKAGGRIFVYIVSSVLNILWLLALGMMYRKKTKSPILISLSILMIVANLSACSWQYFDIEL